MNESDRPRELVVSDELRVLHRNLQIVRGGIVVAAAALHYQNGDRDKDIAAVLEHLVGDRLADQIERTAHLLTTLNSAAPRASTGGERDGQRDGPQEIRERGSYWPTYVISPRTQRSAQGRARIASSRGLRLECRSALQQQQ